MSLNDVFASNVRLYREKKNLSQEKLAELAGIHRTYVSGIECGRRNVSLGNIEKIAQALEVDAFILLKKEN